MSLSKVSDFVLSMLVLSILLLPVIGIFTETDELMAKQEKRILAKRPRMPTNFVELTEFPYEFNRFFDDNFYLRRQAIEFRSFLKVVLLGVSSHKNVIVGKDNWLFYNAKRLVDDYRGLLPMSEGEVRQTIRSFEYRSEILARVKIPYLLVIVPNKQTVYSEFLPDKFSKVGSKTKLDQIVEGLEKSGKVNYLDLRKILPVTRKSEPLYFKYGTHWNQRGAFWGYQQVMKRVNKLLPTAPVLELDDILLKTGAVNGRGLSRFLSLNWYLKEKKPLFLVKNPSSVQEGSGYRFGHIFTQLGWVGQPLERRPFAMYSDKGVGRALIFRDSFCTNMVPYFSESFRESMFVWEKMKPEYLLLILRGGFFPDLVIEEIVERFVRQ